MKRYLVGIDLGTTHTVVAYAPLAVPGADGPPAIHLLDIEQLVAPGEVAARPLLPSVRYHPAPGELADGDLQLPWPAAPEGDGGEAPGQPAPVIGRLARQLGAQVPGRLVSSAKSWLSHATVDRLAPILPWGAAADVAKVSPVQASASYLRHVRSAWDARFPEAPLAQQELVLTVPASFDEGARALTLRAARQAGLPRLRLLEEPQAAFYDWLFRHRDSLDTELAQTRLVLVCDVGGGTTDLSLIQVGWADGQPVLTRIGVGNHLMLGGDNMDLALAHRVESGLAAPAGPSADPATPAAPRLSAARLAQLTERCRAAKELLLAAEAPEQTQVTLLGGGARLIGASRSVTLTREDVARLVVDGFFPAVAATDSARQGRSGIVEFGLPYARDPAITRHLADFLRQHAPAVRQALAGDGADGAADDPAATAAALAVPDTLLLNGGVFRADALVRRLTKTLAGWRGAPLRQLHNPNPDVAVARGAVAYALAQQGLAPQIGGGSARSYYLVLDDPAAPARRGICILPRGSEPGQEILLGGRTFALRLGRPVRFHLATALADAADQAPERPGELVDLDPQRFARLPPIATVLQAAPGGPQAQDIPVQLLTSLTEVGTLEMHCVSLADPGQRWLLEFDLRQDGAEAEPAAITPEARRAAASLAQAIDKIDRIFGTNKQKVEPRDVTQLRAQLERLLGERERWTPPVLRALFDALWQRARGRRRTVAHERVWLNLAGFCLRPGFGDPLDGWRMQQLWSLFPAGVQYASDHQVCAEWWTLWRRVAGGLAAPEQLRLLDDFAFNLHINEEGAEAGTPRPVKGSDEDMLRLGASLERIPVDYKTEIGQWLLGRLEKSTARGRTGDPAGDSRLLAALGRIGARQPFYGNTHDVVPVEVVTGWMDTLLALDWKRIEPAAFAAVHLARVTGDRTRDLPEALRERIAQRLQALNAPPIWLDMVRQCVQLDEATERRVLGESLPPGLKLMV
jgi:molecular chaperone DnaK (HSP70)